MANLPPNSFLKPVEPVQASPYQRIDPKALGGLQPLVSDLIQVNAPKNKFMASTYSADPNAIKTRLDEYEAYNPTQFEGLQNYLSPMAAATDRGKQYFKKGTVNQALGNLTGLDADRFSKLSPLMGGAQAVGKVGDMTYYDRPTLDSALSKYKFIPKQAWDMYSDIATQRGVTPVADLTNQLLINQSDFEKFPGQKFYTSQGLVNPDDPASSYYDVGGRRYAVGSPANDLLPSLGKYNTQVYSIDPVTGQRNQVEGIGGRASSLQMATAVRDPRFQSWLAADDRSTMADDLVREVWRTDPESALRLYGQQAARREGGPDKTPDTFAFTDEAYWPAVYGGKQWDLSPSSGAINGAVNALKLNTPGAQRASDWWGSAMSPGAQSARNDPDKGLFGTVFGVLDPVLDKLDPMHNTGQNLVTKGLGFDSQEQAFGTIMPMVVDYFLPGVGSGLSAANSASVGNWGGALAGALGSYTGLSGNALNLTSNAAINQALTKAAITGAGTAVSGGKMQDVLRNAALSGLATYGGGVMGGATKNLSPLAKMAAQTAYGSGVGGLSSAIQGKGFSRGASNAARRGVTNAAINAALNSQLYKGLV